MSLVRYKPISGEIQNGRRSELLQSIELLQSRYSSLSNSHSIGTRLSPIVAFFERYSKALDCLSQSMGAVGFNPVSLIWGTLRLVLEMASSFTRYFPKFIAMLERLGAVLSLYGRYEQLFPDSSRIHESLCIVYDDVLCILLKAQRVFELSAFRLFIRNAWVNFESDFNNRLDSLTCHTRLLDDEINFAHRKCFQDFLLLGTSKVPLDKSARDAANLLQNRGSSVDLNIHRTKQLLLKWLDPTDVSPILQHYAEKRLVGTCDWLLKDQRFRTWIDQDRRTSLWIYGLSGSGKSVMSTAIVQECVRKSTAAARLVASYYFRYHARSGESLMKMLATIIAQILVQDSTTVHPVYEAYQTAERFGRSRITTMDSPEYLLIRLLSTRPRLDIIIDGLDEYDCPLEILKSLRRMARSSNIHFAVFSRDTSAVRLSLADSLIIELSPKVVQSDIERCIRDVVEDYQFEDLALAESLIARISQKTNGMFLWAAEILKTFQSAASAAQVLERLELLPDGLYEYYGRHMDRLASFPASKHELSRRVFRWLCCTYRLLGWEELQAALANSPGRDTASRLENPFKTIVLEICGPLAYHDFVDGKVKLQHSSVHQYLTTSLDPMLSVSETSKSFFVRREESHQDIAATCLQLVKSSHSTSNPLYGYALRYWHEHAIVSINVTSLFKSVKSFLGVRQDRRRWIKALLLSDQKDLSLQKLFRFQHLLNHHLSGAPGPDHWTEDVAQALFQIDCEAQDGTARKLTYFDNLMIVRDLSRELTQTGMLQDAVGWFSDHFRAQSDSREETQTAWILNSLGILYDQQGDSSRSLETHLQALNIQERALGPSHMNTLWTVNELGRVYRHLRDYAKAEELHKRALDVLSRTLSAEHLEVLWTQNTLARVYRQQRRYADGLALHECALTGREKILGRQHPHTLWVLSDIAQCHKDLGRLRKAEELHREVLRGRERQLGAEHPDTLWTMNNLGAVLEKRGQREKAFAMQKLALKGQERVLGRNHAHTRWTAAVLESLKIN